MDKRVVTLMGAGGKMGCRITDMIAPVDRYEVRYVEPGEEGQERLAERGHEVTERDQALRGTDFVIMAVPDELIGSISEEVVPKVDPGTTMVLLDPAAAHAGKLPEREDVTYFVTHPSHPSFFTAESKMTDEDPDWFGGQGRDPQTVVCALHQGPESDYEPAERLAKDMYAPVTDAYRVTTEQMAILEPALSETLTATCLDVIREGKDRAVEMGVPEEAAEDFLFGHIRIELGIIFGFTDFPFSDGAQEAIEEAKDSIFAEDWKEQVFDRDQIERSVDEISSPD